MSIQTLVFFDLETTGIPASGAKITEITLISISRSDIEEADGTKSLPISKLSLLCNPQKDIQPAAVKITGLTNKFLKSQPVFKDVIKCINSFLDKPKPVCLVAHNGNKYDFKILQAEYFYANETLPQDLVCIDSLNIFRSILKESKNCSDGAVQNTSSNFDESNVNELQEDWLDLSKEDINEIDKLIDEFSYLTSTPNAKKVKTEKMIKTLEPEKKLKVSYTLSSIYERLLNKKVQNAHRAEADCIMLLECAVATKKEFLAYADSNYMPIANKIYKLY